MPVSSAREEQFVTSLADGFTSALNKSAGRCRFCNQDGFEVLLSVFGEGFTEAQVRAATPEQLARLVEQVRSYLELESATPESVQAAFQAGLWQAG
ncbi:MAG: hypothetical protein Q8L48_22895 [Archangium sp.]|nr:hypothetical protein [Archangium sp.]